MNNEEQIIDTIKRCKEFPTILELHNKYFNKLLGKKIPFTYKSFKMLMWDACVAYLNYNVKIIDLDMLLADNGSVELYGNCCTEIGEREIHYFMLNSSEFIWKNDILNMLDKYE